MMLNYAPLIGVALLAMVYAVRAGHSRYLLDGAILIIALCAAPRVARPIFLVLPCVALITARHWPWRRSVGVGAWLLRAFVPGAVEVRAATGATELLRPPPARPVAPPSAPAVRLPMAAWLERANRTPTYPHLAIVGGTRLGKTTMAQLLAGDGDGDLVICTPKAAWEDGWAGADVVRTAAANGDPDWSPIAHAVGAVYRELYARRDGSSADRQPIRLILDELTEALDEIPALRQQLIRMLKTGASVGIRLIVIDPEYNVRAWGIDGRSDILSSMLVMTVHDDRSWSMARGGMRGAAPDLLDTRGVFDRASAVCLAGRGWAIPDPGGLSSGLTDSRQTDRHSADETLIEELYTARGLRDRDRMRATLRSEYGLGLDNNKFSAVKKRLEG